MIFVLGEKKRKRERKKEKKREKEIRSIYSVLMGKFKMRLSFKFESCV